jgi:hypothetical protein
MINIKKFFEGKPKPDVYLLVRQGSYGLETFVNDKMLELKPGYKSQMVAFLKEIVEVMDGKSTKANK